MASTELFLRTSRAVRRRWVALNLAGLPERDRANLGRILHRLDAAQGPGRP